jgi:predicted transposase YbfD/YdcC
MSGLLECFSEIEDPRAGNCTYRVGDLLVLMVAGSLCGLETAVDIADFAAMRKAVLNQLVPYRRAPSHDTFSRLLRLLDPQVLAKTFEVFAAAFAKALAAEGIAPAQNVIAVDGKALRRAYETGLSHHPPLTVSAFAAGAKLCLAAADVGRDNEVETALKIVGLLDLTGKILTADALHCHHRMAEAVVAQKGDYVLALKANRPAWFHAAEQGFASGGKHAAGKHKRAAEETSTAHGRHEWRKAEVIAAERPLTKSHQAFLRITSKRGTAKPLVRYYLSSRLLSPREALAVVRAHWQIENNLHWMLDVHLAEDASRARKDNAPANTALIKRIARNILQTADDNPKRRISQRIKACNWNNDYLINALTHMR